MDILKRDGINNLDVFFNEIVNGIFAVFIVNFTFIIII